MTKTALRLSLIALLFVSAAVAQQKAPPAKAAAAPALDPNKPIAITGGKLLTITHGTIENGVVVIENGKITAVGAAGSVKVPGRRAGHRRQGHDGVSRADRFGDPLGSDRDQRREARPTTWSSRSDEIMPHMHVADAFHAESALIPVARYNGITNAIVAPESDDTLPGPGFVHSVGRRRRHADAADPRHCDAAELHRLAAAQ